MPYRLLTGIIWTITWSAPQNEFQETQVYISVTESCDRFYEILKNVLSSEVYLECIIFVNLDNSFAVIVESNPTVNLDIKLFSNNVHVLH